MWAMTDKPDAPGGAQTLRYRQSSPPPLDCMHWLAKAVAFSVPLQGAAAWGGAQRRFPTGGAAKGIPCHELMPLTTMPQTVPLSVCTVVPASHALSRLTMGLGGSLRSPSRRSYAPAFPNATPPANGSTTDFVTRASPAVVTPIASKMFAASIQDLELNTAKSTARLNRNICIPPCCQSVVRRERTRKRRSAGYQGLSRLSKTYRCGATPVVPWKTRAKLKTDKAATLATSRATRDGRGSA